MRLGFILGVVALAGAASLRVRAQEIDVYVNSPRPLAEAVKEFERRCKCVITYEDLKWRSDQVEPSPIFRRRSDGAAAMIPRGIPFTFTVPQDLAQMSPAVIGQHFDSVLGSFEAIQNPGEFKVVRGERSIHVIPAASAILNRPICVIADGVPAITAVRTALNEVSRLSGEKLDLWTLPLNIVKRPIHVTMSHQPAQEVLTRILAAADQRLSWHLFYDVNLQTYFLTIYLAYH